MGIQTASMQRIVSRRIRACLSATRPPRQIHGRLPRFSLAGEEQRATTIPTAVGRAAGRRLAFDGSGAVLAPKHYSAGPQNRPPLAMPVDTALRPLLAECRRLLSERGEANGPLIAQAILARIDALREDQRGRFFERLASDFSPDPKAVLASAQAYAAAPDAAHQIALARVAEPPRQELFRRLNRAPGGTAAERLVTGVGSSTRGHASEGMDGGTIAIS